MLAKFRNCFLSFSGTLDRSAYWRRTVAIVVIFFVSTHVLTLLLNLFFVAIGARSYHLVYSHPVIFDKVVLYYQPILFLILLLSLIMLWSIFSISARRLHDRQRPVWLVIPMIGLPIALQVGCWIFSFYDPLSAAFDFSAGGASGQGLVSPEIMLPRVMVPVWSLLELGGTRIYGVFLQIPKGENTWPIYLAFLLPATGLSAWACIELGCLPARVSPVSSGDNR